MKHRDISVKILEYAKAMPVVTVTGPRQSGKTTLCRALFPDKPYVNLEALDERAFALDDPRGFLARFPDGAVLDEIQRAPDLVSYIQVAVDESRRDGMFVLTGSQNLLLMASVSQSLAGRTALATLLPFTRREAYGDDPPDLMAMLVRGFFPRVASSDVSPFEMLSFYIATYVERDVRNLLQVKDSARFDTFLRLCAGRTGQLLNYSTLASDAGVSVNTAKDWISILETSYVLRRLPPWFANVNKQLSKTPKLFFLDTGLVCCLLGISTPSHLTSHPLRGAIFETFVVNEMWKRQANACQPDALYHYRDGAKNEVDVVEATGEGLRLTEIKSGATVATDWTRTIERVSSFLPDVKASRVVFGGQGSSTRHGTSVVSWRNFSP